jgi:hypothetical protein
MSSSVPAAQPTGDGSTFGAQTWMQIWMEQMAVKAATTAP